MNKMLGTIKLAYPRFGEGQDLSAIADIWMMVFGNVDYTVAGDALAMFIDNDTKGFPPVPGQVKQYVKLLHRSQQPLGMSEFEIVAAIRRAVRNSGYNYSEEFAKLPVAAQKVAGDPMTLHSWAMMTESDFNTVVTSNLLRGIRMERERTADYEDMQELMKSRGLSEYEARKSLRMLPEFDDWEAKRGDDVDDKTNEEGYDLDEPM